MRQPTTYNLQPNHGFGLLEIIIAVAIIAGSLFALAEVSALAVRLTQTALAEQQALFLSEAGIENARFARDSSWATLLASAGAETIDAFTRTTTLENVYRRNSDDDIIPVSSPDPKTIDPNTRKVTVTISWQGRKGIMSTSLSAYLTNLFEL
jgi:prepilin-type N-terminal cleavage/methylation domain-containing protein